MATGKAPATLPAETKPAQTESTPTSDYDGDGFVPQETAKDHRQGPFLVGRSESGTVRRITEADFASVGIECRTLEFNWLEGYRIPLRQVPQAAAEFLVANEYGFSISDE